MLYRVQCISKQLSESVSYFGNICNAPGPPCGSAVEWVTDLMSMMTHHIQQAVASKEILRSKAKLRQSKSMVHMRTWSICLIPVSWSIFPVLAYRENHALLILFHLNKSHTKVWVNTQNSRSFFGPKTLGQIRGTRREMHQRWSRWIAFRNACSLEVQRRRRNLY